MRAALEWHPDRHVDRQGPRTARKEAEAKFKAVSEALDVLIDPFMRKLWDEGHDLDRAARAAVRPQQAGQQAGRYMYM